MSSERCGCSTTTASCRGDLALAPHQDVEGLTYVVEGSFGHEDNVGGAYGPLPAGSVQRMTLGSGALHSEQNASQSEPMRFIQIWILPDTPSLAPAVEQKVFTTRTAPTGCSA